MTIRRREDAGTTTTTGPDVPAPAYRARPVAPAGPDASVAARPGPRRARLAVRRVDPWSVLKLTFVFSLALLIVWVVAVTVLYAVLNAMGVFDSVQSAVGVFAEPGTGTSSARLTEFFSFRRVLGWAAVIGAVNVLLFSALSTLAAFLYNLCADLAGGIEVTLTERS